MNGHAHSFGGHALDRHVFEFETVPDAAPGDVAPSFDFVDEPGPDDVLDLAELETDAQPPAEPTWTAPDGTTLTRSEWEDLQSFLDERLAAAQEQLNRELIAEALHPANPDAPLNTAIMNQALAEQRELEQAAAAQQRQEQQREAWALAHDITQQAGLPPKHVMDVVNIGRGVIEALAAEAGKPASAISDDEQMQVFREVAAALYKGAGREGGCRELDEFISLAGVGPSMRTDYRDAAQNDSVVGKMLGRDRHIYNPAR